MAGKGQPGSLKCKMDRIRTRLFLHIRIILPFTSSLTLIRFFFCFFLPGWNFLAVSTTWPHRCSPAVLQTRCCPVQPKSGRWRESCPPPDVWQHAKLWARCWHSDASRLESPGWCTGQFLGRTVLMQWVCFNTNNFYTSFLLMFYLFYYLVPYCLYQLFTGSIF